MDKKAMGARIKNLRIKHGLTQLELGQRLGVGLTTISNYERGYSTPDVKSLIMLANTFSVTIDYIVKDNHTLSVEKKIQQPKFCLNLIPYFDIENTSGILLGDSRLADGNISLPTDKRIDTQALICTNVCDNTMANAGIKQSSYIIVDRNKGPINGETALVYCCHLNKFIIRKFVADGPMIMLMCDGYGDDTSTIYTNCIDNNYKIIGAVVRAIINM